MLIDRKGHAYQEVDMPNGSVRVTYIENGWAGSPAVRVQIRDDAGHLRQGPEIPLGTIGGVFGAIFDLAAT